MFKKLLDVVIWDHGYAMGKIFGDTVLVRFRGKHIEEKELNKRLKLFQESNTIKTSSEFLDGFKQGYWVLATADVEITVTVHKHLTIKE